MMRSTNGCVMATKSGWYFDGEAGSSKDDISRWWWERRYRYNRVLFFVGAGTWLLVEFAGSASVKPGVDFEEPLIMIIGPVFYALFANLFYTAGPILDTAIYRGSPRKYLLKAGYIFSLAVTSLPGLWALAVWLWTMAVGVKLD